MQRFESYKPSGEIWLGDVPAHWEIFPFKGLFRMSAEKNGKKIVGEMLSVSGYRGIEIKPYEFEEQKRTDAELRDYRVVRPGQLVVNTMWLNHTGLGVSDFAGHVSPAYRSYWFDPKLRARYAHYLMRSHSYVQGYTGQMQGIRPNSLQIKNSDFTKIPILVPPHDEQDRIVAFLDQKTAEIDAAIAKKERLIGLLSEQLTLLQTKVISYGLNQQHSERNWRSVPLKWFIKIGSGDFLASEKITSEPDQLHAVPVIGGNGVMGYTAESNTNTRVIAVGRVGALCGNVHPIEMPAWITDNALRITCSSDFDFAYMVTALRSLNLNRLANKSAQPLITGSMIKDQIVSLPPLDEQVAISQYLADAERSTNHTCRSIENEIQRLLELRSLVISHTVTGMIRI